MSLSYKTLNELNITMMTDEFNLFFAICQAQVLLLGLGLARYWIFKVERVMDRIGFAYQWAFAIMGLCTHSWTFILISGLLHMFMSFFVCSQSCAYSGPIRLIIYFMLKFPLKFWVSILTLFVSIILNPKFDVPCVGLILGIY